MIKTNNPAIDGLQQFYGGNERAEARTNVSTLQGVVNATAILVLITCCAGAVGYKLLGAVPNLTMISAIAAFVIVLGLGFILRGKPQLAPFLAPMYAVVEGVFLGSFTATLDGILLSQKAFSGAGGVAAAGSVSLALPAFIVTVSAMVGMLALYSARIIRPTRKFQAVMSVLVTGIMITYGLMFVLSFFGISMPFLSLSSAGGSGMTPFIGLGLSALFLVVASLCLINDFGRIEQIVDSGAPKYMQWYAGFALLVTLTWIYYEAVKLLFRLYLMFGNRD